MELSDRDERVTVTLTVDDWGMIVAALAGSSVSLETKHRINVVIFDAAQQTMRLLS